MQSEPSSVTRSNADANETAEHHELARFKPEIANVKNSKELLLAEALSLMGHWRANKKAHTDAIPGIIWQKLHLLRTHYSAKQLSSLFQIPTANIEDKSRLLTKNESKQQPALASTAEVKSEAKNSSPSPLSLCEARVQPAVTIAQADKIYAPIQVEQKKTLVVELQRQDGMILKIYATTETVQDIFHAFMKG